MKIKKRNLLIIGLLALGLNLFSCRGEDGTIGPLGPRGEQGIQGKIGPAGADGSIIYSGEGKPISATGIKGDYYFDLTTGILYGPKESNKSWEKVATLLLKGANGKDGINGTNGEDGTNGKDGNKILSGNGEPTNATGNTGDYYLDKDAYTLYGPKKDNWDVGLMLKGADGNANVRTFTYTVNKSEWEINNAHGVSTAYNQLRFSALNQDVYDNGIVLVYRQTTYIRYPLPSTIGSASKSTTFSYYLSKGRGEKTPKITFNIRRFGNAPVPTMRVDYRIKIITGQSAEQLNALKNSPKKLYKAALKMRIIK